MFSVLVCPLGLWDVRKIVDAGQRDVYVRFVDQVYSSLYTKLKEEPALKKNQTQFSVVIDMKGLTLRQFTSPSSKCVQFGAMVMVNGKMSQ